MTSYAFFGLNADDASLNEVVHDAAIGIYVSNKLTIVANNLGSDDVIRRHACNVTYYCTRHIAHKPNHLITTQRIIIIIIIIIIMIIVIVVITLCMLN